ncbi:MAG: hypothetical protein MI744_06875 [Pseudomonadales bacterium]|nr:hypothetical protein [Pseudomonadales bacterium]
MKKILPHIEIGLDQYGAVAVSVEDYELFDFIDDYVTEECDLDWQEKTVKEAAKGEVHTMYFNPKHSLAEVEVALLKLDPEKVEKYMRLTTEQASTKVFNKVVNGTLDFPHFSRHASITPKREKNDACNEHGEEDPKVQH